MLDSLVRVSRRVVWRRRAVNVLSASCLRPLSVGQRRCRRTGVAVRLTASPEQQQRQQPPREGRHALRQQTVYVEPRARETYRSRRIYRTRGLFARRRLTLTLASRKCTTYELRPHKPRLRSGREIARCGTREAESGNANCRLHSLPFQRFHVLFNSLFRVLFIFPSRYLFAIGLVSVFSFRWSLPPFLGCNPKQPDSWKALREPSDRYHVRGCHPL